MMKLLCRIADRLRLGRRGEERRGERNVSAEEKGEKREKMKKKTHEYLNIIRVRFPTYENE